MFDGTTAANSLFSIVDASFNIRKGRLSYQFALLDEFILVAAMNWKFNIWQYVRLFR